MPNSPDLQNKVAELTQQFPKPRVQTDDGNQDVADLHAREDLLLENYSWVDPAHTKVRIPIERAMELIAQRGLPVAPSVQTAPAMTGESTPVIQVPLTNGFARTGFEQEEAQARAIQARQQEREQVANTEGTCRFFDFPPIRNKEVEILGHGAIFGWSGWLNTRYSR